MKNNLLKLLMLLLISTFTKAQVTVNGGPTATYTTLNAAFAAINAGTHFGAITIDITASTTEGTVGYLPTPLLASGQSAANYTSILIRPTAQATISGAPASGRGVIELDGADNVTINGDIVAGPVNRDLQFENVNASNITLTAVIRLIGRTTLGLGATNNIIENCVIRGSTEGNDGISGSTVNTSYGIYAGSNAVNLTSLGLGDFYTNNTIRNNEFKKAYYGVWIGGTTTNLAYDNLIIGNIIGSNTVGETITAYGIGLNGAVTNTITQNEIFNLNTISSVSPYGIYVGTSATSASITISRNKIYDIKAFSTSGYGAFGINLSGGSNHWIVNNVIYDIMTVNYLSTSTLNAFGIRLTSGTGHRIYYNSIHLFGQIDGTTATANSVGSAALMVTSTGVTDLEMKNNIFSNTQTSTLTTVTTKKFMAVRFPNLYNFLNATLDNNAYNVPNDGDHFVGWVGATNNVNEASNLFAWQALSQVNNATNDINSVPVVNAAAPFTSNTNLNIPTNTNYDGESGALVIPALGTNIDIDANVRPKTGTNPNLLPDIGAYEFDGISGFPTDAGLSVLVSPAATGCYSANENVIVTIKNYGTSSISSIPVTVIVSGTISQTLTGTYAGTIAPTATFDYTIGTVNMSAAGTYTFDGFTSLSGDMQSLNDPFSTQTRTVVGSSPIPQFVDFTGFTGANLSTVFPLWSEGDGATLPLGTTSSWLNQTNFNTIGNTSARVYLSAAANTEWIVGPKILATANTNISFDAGVSDNTASPFNPDAMGSDDMVQLMISTDCGASYTPIYTISATNSLTPLLNNFNVSLAAYAGQNIIVGFLATDGPVDDPEAYYFHLDNINLYNASPFDAGTSAITSPGNNCYTSAEPVVVDVTNYGTSSINNFPVTAWINGPLTQTITNTFTASLAPAAVASFTIGTINMSTAGTYTLKTFTGLSGDVNNLNDSTLVTKTTLPLGTLPQFVPFTGFTGSNLTTLFPDWREGDGSSLPLGNISSWTSQTNFPAATNVNARVYLSTNVNTEWIVGPKVLATANTNMSFDAGITAGTTAPFLPDAMGSDDKVQVMVSTDCGNSYTPIYTISATNSLTTSFTNFNVNLAAYAGQEIIVAFLATDGPVIDAESYYFHLDNINLFNSSPTDAGTDAIVAPGNACYTNAEPVVVNVKNYGNANITNFPVNVWVSGAITQTLTSTFTGVLTPGSSANFTVGTINMTAAGNYSLKTFPSLLGDSNANNDTTFIVKNTLPLGTIPQFVSFTGFNGSNLTTLFPDWREGDGPTTPIGTTSSWINQNNFPIAGNVNARVYLSAVANTEWIVGPKVLATASTQIAFDAAVTDNVSSPYNPDVMGSDDMVQVMVSTDCGNSYSPVSTISATNNLTTSFTNFNISLAAYAGQEIIVAFLATDGPVDDVEAYYFHLDNINLYNNSATDGGVTAILSPTVDACLSTTEQIVVTVKNFGLGALTNFPVTAIIGGPISSTVTSNYTGTLAPSATDNFTIGVANMNVSGTYSINAFTGVSGDPNAFNDATSMSTTQTPDFGISGGNLICTAGTVTLNTTGSAVSYTWSNASNSNSIVVSPAVSTTYSALGTGTNNCIVSTFFTVTVSNPTITGVGASVCGTTAIGTLSANAFAPVSWYASPSSTVVLSTGNTFTATAATTTTYYVEAVSGATGSLQTTFADNLGCGAGAMFDLTATNGAIVIDSLDVNSSIAASSTFSIFLYYKTGTYVGSETNTAAWTAWDTVVVTSAGSGNPSRVVPVTLNLPNNQVYGIYANYTARYTTTTSAYSNSDLLVQAGAGFCTAFSGPINGRAFNGNIYYTKPGCTSPKIPVTLTVNPTPTLSVNASTTTICEGTNITLTASGVDTYTWSTTATGSSIIETPTVTTTYTVNGTSNLCNSVETETVLINVNAKPSLTLTSTSSTICQSPGSIALTGLPNGGVYSGTGVTANFQSIAVAGTFMPSYSFTNTTTGCSNTTSTTIIISNCTGLSNQSVNSSTISIYPNPNNGKFVVETQTTDIKEIKIMDITGKLIAIEKTSLSVFEVNIQELKNGMYYVSVNTNGTTEIFKLIKQ